MESWKEGAFMQAKTLLPLSKLNFEQLVESITENPLISNDPSEKQPKNEAKKKLNMFTEVVLQHQVPITSIYKLSQLCWTNFRRGNKLFPNFDSEDYTFTCHVDACRSEGNKCKFLESDMSPVIKTMGCFV